MAPDPNQTSPPSPLQGNSFRLSSSTYSHTQWPQNLHDPITQTTTSSDRWLVIAQRPIIIPRLSR
ncbi:uncharacterized protein BO96DRAFT_2751 [Aspergillus niger CBS 101883]|uniref:uncharacterized protein n=1 Tax=Aspergillus lacticoffeatus (strain CBS 101883) TaxID=1450533 RepID=UPI000D8040AA|nr:uncharacterized protein BO96DRAFT_2751 [Aspergillus niger CBS 101883]PYH61807.1 hypothetical protein BO96DRAFT_2751 [Aspergillus niger CBS 101883]